MLEYSRPSVAAGSIGIARAAYEYALDYAQQRVAFGKPIIKHEGIGFKLAEIDLELRGEGELVGTRQHGEAQFRMAELPRDAELLDRARRYAERVVGNDPELAEPEHALLADALVGSFGAEALAPIRA